MKFAAAGLARLLEASGARVFALHVSDRFGDHGLVGAAVVQAGEILGLAISCRVLGMGVDHSFMQFILDDLSTDHGAVQARIIPTSRNAPVRNLYRDNGFAQDEDGVWRKALRETATG